ncbi:MAG: hypothetical protein JNL17_01055 [Cyclobacteriaceae bacterium]|nr:hypothetical protein [Cyclobacteriaceae bacterium]
MSDYLRLNRQKILHGLLISFGLFVIVQSLIYVALMTLLPQFEKGDPFDVILLMVASSAGISAFVMILALTTGFAEHQRKLNVFAKGSFAALLKWGFVRVELLTKNKLWLNEVAWIKELKGFLIVLNSNRKDYVEVTILVRHPSQLADTSKSILRNSELLVMDQGLQLNFIVHDYLTPDSSKMQEYISRITDRLIELGVQPEQSTRPYEQHLIKSKLKRIQVG